MIDSLPYIVGASAFLVVVVVAVREHNALRISRRNLLDHCRAVLDNGDILHDADDFPSMTGTWHGHRVNVQLIPDTMTIRRLPQLWLSVTLLAAQPRAGAFAALVRHTGYEFYSLITQFGHALSPTPGLPSEIVLRGRDAKSQELLEAMQEPLAAIFSDARVKEVAVTPKGLRVVWQAGEGRRGEHLLLRQAVFDDAQVAAADLETILSHFSALQASVDVQRGVRAA